MDVKGYPWSFMEGVEAFVRRKTRELAIANGGVLDGNHRRARVEAAEAVHEGKKHIPAPKAVVLYN